MIRQEAGIIQFRIELIRYKELLEKAGERNLVRVKTTKTTENMPRFRIMSDVDLEVNMWTHFSRMIILQTIPSTDCSKKAEIYSWCSKEPRHSW